MARNETFTLEKNGTVRNGVDSTLKFQKKKGSKTYAYRREYLIKKLIILKYLLISLRYVIYRKKFDFFAYPIFNRLFVGVWDEHRIRIFTLF
jgi:hypothetical protein